MRQEHEIFNATIRKMVRQQPNSSGAVLIKKLEKSGFNYSGYYDLFDMVARKLGITVLAEQLIDEEKDKVLGYRPILKYYPGNKINATPGEKNLCANFLTYNKCHEIMAKELVSRIQQVPDIEKFLSND